MWTWEDQSEEPWNAKWRERQEQELQTAKEQLAEARSKLATAQTIPTDERYLRTA